MKLVLESTDTDANTETKQKQERAKKQTNTSGTNKQNEEKCKLFRLKDGWRTAPKTRVPAT